MRFLQPKFYDPVIDKVFDVNQVDYEHSLVAGGGLIFKTEKVKFIPPLNLQDRDGDELYLYDVIEYYYESDGEMRCVVLLIEFDLHEGFAIDWSSDNAQRLLENVYKEDMENIERLGNYYEDRELYAKIIGRDEKVI